MSSPSARIATAVQRCTSQRGGDLARRLSSPPGHFLFARQVAHEFGGDAGIGQALASLWACCRSGGAVAYRLAAPSLVVC